MMHLLLALVTSTRIKDVKIWDLFDFELIWFNIFDATSTKPVGEQKSAAVSFILTKRIETQHKFI